jgi:hypothetical protein
MAPCVGTADDAARSRLTDDVFSPLSLGVTETLSHDEPCTKASAQNSCHAESDSQLVVTLDLEEGGRTERGGCACGGGGVKSQC